MDDEPAGGLVVLQGDVRRLVDGLVWTGIVDVPNAVATLAVPIRIFSVDVRPKKLTPGVSCKLSKVAALFALFFPLRTRRGHARVESGICCEQVSPNCCISSYDGDKKAFVNPSGDY